MHTISLLGITMPALGFGTYQLTGRTCVDAVKSAIDIGYRHIDTAQIYENEAEVGNAVATSGIARSNLFITTKLWTNNYTQARVAESVEESLNKLRTDYVDLLLMHWPNPAIPLVETLNAMQKLMHRGKIKAIGVSNFPLQLLKQAKEECGAPIICNQVEYHPLLSQKILLDYTQTHTMALTAYSPLARGRMANHPTLERIGKAHGKTASQITLRWLIDQKNVAAIPKAASELNQRLNFAIFDFELTKADTAAINALSGDNRFVNPGFAPKWDVA